jgi:hypothetical protein
MPRVQADSVDRLPGADEEMAGLCIEAGETIAVRSESAWVNLIPRLGQADPRHCGVVVDRIHATIIDCSVGCLAKWSRLARVPHLGVRELVGGDVGAGSAGSGDDDVVFGGGLGG